MALMLNVDRLSAMVLSMVLSLNVDHPSPLVSHRADKLQRAEADRAFKEITPFHCQRDLQRSESIAHKNRQKCFVSRRD
jgi:hypothetical protein